MGKQIVAGAIVTKKMGRGVSRGVVKAILKSGEAKVRWENGKTDNNDVAKLTLDKKAKVNALKSSSNKEAVAKIKKVVDQAKKDGKSKGSAKGVSVVTKKTDTQAPKKKTASKKATKDNIKPKLNATYEAKINEKVFIINADDRRNKIEGVVIDKKDGKTRVQLESGAKVAVKDNFVRPLVKGKRTMNRKKTQPITEQSAQSKKIESAPKKPHITALFKAVNAHFVNNRKALSAEGGTIDTKKMVAKLEESKTIFETALRKMGLDPEIFEWYAIEVAADKATTKK